MTQRLDGHFNVSTKTVTNGNRSVNQPAHSPQLVELVRPTRDD